MPAMGLSDQDAGRGDCLSGDASLMSTNTIAISEVPARPLTLRLHEWVTTVDHKRLGILYILYALDVSGTGRSRSHHHARATHPAAQRLCLAPGFQSHVHDAWHDDDLFRRHADGFWIRELSGAADDRRPRHGVPPAQCVQLLDDRAGRTFPVFQFFRRRWTVLAFRRSKTKPWPERLCGAPSELRRFAVGSLEVFDPQNENFGGCKPQTARMRKTTCSRGDASERSACSSSRLRKRSHDFFRISA